MKALAFANNDIAVIAWTLDKKLGGCLGFAVYRLDVHAGTATPLLAMARFEATAGDAQETTEQAPVQKFWWKDLYAARETLYRYKIVPMGGKPGALRPLDGIDPLLTNAIALTPKRGSFEAYFLCRAAVLAQRYRQRSAWRVAAGPSQERDRVQEASSRKPPRRSRTGTWGGARTAPHTGRPGSGMRVWLQERPSASEAGGRFRP